MIKQNHSGFLMKTNHMYGLEQCWHLAAAKTFLAVLANPGQMPNGQITNQVSISTLLAFGHGQNFFGRFGQTANGQPRPNGQCANTELGDLAGRTNVD